jgi:hypothetical protein
MSEAANATWLTNLQGDSPSSSYVSISISTLWRYAFIGSKDHKLPSLISFPAKTSRPNDDPIPKLNRLCVAPESTTANTMLLSQLLLLRIT